MQQGFWNEIKDVMLRLISRSVGDEEFTDKSRTDTARKGMQVSIVTEFWCFDAYFYK